MRVLHVTPGFYPAVGGIEKYVEDLCVKLKNMGIVSDVLTLNRKAYSEERMKGYEVYRGIKIFRIPSLSVKYYYFAPEVLRYVGGYDVIHIHGLNFFCDFLSLTKLFHKKPLVLSTHGGIFHTRKIYRLKKLYFNYWCKAFLKRIDKVISVSRQDAELFSGITEPLMIPDGVDYKEFSAIKREPVKHTMLYIGRISRNKRVENLINTVYFLKKRFPDVKLYIAGGDWQGIRKDLEALAESKALEKDVIFKGEVGEKEKNRLLARCQLFVSASRYEGFGISVVEAMAAGIPCAVSNIEAFRNFITSGRNGFLVDYSKSEEAAERIYKIMGMDLQTMSKNAKEAVKEYDWSRIVRRILNIYNHAIKE